MNEAADPLSIDVFARSGWRDYLGAEHDRNFGGLWTRFSDGAAAMAAKDPNVSAVLALFAGICSLALCEGSWMNPYAPRLVTHEGRTLGVADLTTEELEFLVLILPEVDDPLLSSRFSDLLWLRLSPAQRFPYALKAIQGWIDFPIDEANWFAGGNKGWDRAIEMAKRLGASTSELLARLEQKLVDAVFNREDGFLPLQIAQLLRRHSLGVGEASKIALRMESLAYDRVAVPSAARAYLEGAFRWHLQAGETEAAYLKIILQIESWRAEARALISARPPNSLLATMELENAFQALKLIPRKWRPQFNILRVQGEIQQELRAAGEAAIGEMTEFASDPIDLGSAAEDSISRVRGLDAMASLEALSLLENFASVTKFRDDAEVAMKSAPFASLLTNVHVSPDGRVVHRSSPSGDPIFGYPPAIWRNMIRMYEFRIAVFVQGLIWPALTQLTSEHLFRENDFETIVREAPLVPKDRTRLFAKGLLAGYQFDFASALHLLVPQVENMVRQHMLDAGLPTTSIKDGVESESGLSALMAKAGVEELFSPDLAFELRALFCGPIGPNLRNSVAHGLLDDGGTYGAPSIYAWWLCLRLIFLSFWNKIREARPASEPDDPSQERP